MQKQAPVSGQTRKNWSVDAILLGSVLIAALTGIYFLFLPTGGYRGGRNPYYDIQILFDRSTWDLLHTWGGVAMIAAVAFHLPMHWSWVVNMTKRMGRELTGKCIPMNGRGRFNLVINLVVAISFLLTALSGIYFLFAPGGHGTAVPNFLFSRLTWDLIHTWSAVAMISAAVLHFAIHWRWVIKVTSNIFNAVVIHQDNHTQLQKG
jgi:hypothetical protein